MKFSKSLVLALFCALLFLWSCTVVRINENLNYASSGFSFGSNKTAIVVSSENIAVNEFSKTFQKRFKENSDFVQYHDSLISVKFKSRFVFGTITNDQPLSFVSDNLVILNKEQQNSIDSLFATTTADYLVRISEFEIANSIKGGAPIFMGSPGSGMTIGGGQSESCIVKAHYQVYEVKSRKKILDFVSKGSGGVLFFAFDKALRDAIANSVNNAATYLATGKSKF